MPFLAVRDGERVIPPQVEDGERIHCRLCNEEMSIVASHPRSGGVFVARHFRHRSENGGGGEGGSGGTEECPGESDEHLRMKSIAYSRLKHDFPETTVELEASVGKHRADVLLEFPSARAPYGEGIAVEVQYQNKGKDIEAVDRYYLENGYSVAWLEQEHFTERDVDLSGIRTVWPYAVPLTRGLEGYPDITRWLWQDKSAKVELEVPLPDDFWDSHRQEDEEWLPVVNRDVRRQGRAWVQVLRSPTGALVFELAKTSGSFGGGVESVKVQLSESDVEEIRAFTETVESEAYSGTLRKRSNPGSWEDFATAWLVSGPNTTVWLKAAYSSNGKVVLILGKKQAESEIVRAQVDRTVVTALRDVADLMEEAFEHQQKRA